MRRDDNVDAGGSAPREVSRRTIAKGAAWSVPVVIMATAAPAAASSHDQAAAVFITGTASKGGAGDNREVTFTLTFNAVGTNTITVNSITGYTWTPVPLVLAIPEGQGTYVTFTALRDAGGNNANTDVTISYTLLPQNLTETKTVSIVMDEPPGTVKP